MMCLYLNKILFTLKDIFDPFISAYYIDLYPTIKENHPSLLRAIIEIRIKKLKYIYTIFRSNQFCIISLNNVTVFLKSVYSIRQCLVKGSF